jgi:methanogenic corrinoid protein MtbC1
MLMWCSYCQRFDREVPPYEDFSITHGMCAACRPTAFALTESDIAHARSLQEIQSQLAEAGRHGDFKAAEIIEENAVKANIRPIDILLGIVAPMLYHIGKDWEHSIITVAEEHRFTAFCEHVFESIVTKVRGVPPTDVTETDRAEVLLMSAEGNRHTLAIRILDLWLMNKGIRTHLVHPTLSLDDLMAVISDKRPTTLLLSMALPEQRATVLKTAERVAALPGAIRPKIIVGGYAVKLGLVPEIPGAELVADINTIHWPSRQ